MNDGKNTNREFEILNRKLDMLFDEIIWLRKDLEQTKNEQEMKVLENEVKYSQSKLEDRRMSMIFRCENHDATRNQFRRIESDFIQPKVEEHVEML